MHWDILDKNRQALLPSLQEFKKRGFYLAGGTALALYFGHRDSIDFDFFTPNSFDTGELFTVCEDIFSGYDIRKVQDEKNTLTLFLNDTIKISFFTYSYPQLEKYTDAEYITIASIVDIACMKCVAITSRATQKDYVDLYYILQTMTIGELLEHCVKKYPSIDKNLILKSLVYFDDLITEPILFKNEAVPFEDMKRFLQNTVKAFHKYELLA